LLKPNLVEYERDTVINTHPVIGAAVEAFLKLGAKEVKVGEGPGHRRDTDGLLLASGLYPFLKDTKTQFVDLNLDDIRRVPLQSDFMGIDSLYFADTVLQSDLLVSMPKLKTHHWAGMTLSMKNLFGIVPGIKYGWPKNFLHWHGIHESIVDINSTVQSHFAIVDGIVGMEGNGPIQEPKPVGVLVFGDDPVAVDATCVRVATESRKIEYLRKAGEFLGILREHRSADRTKCRWFKPISSDRRLSPPAELILSSKMSTRLKRSSSCFSSYPDFAVCFIKSFGCDWRLLPWHRTPVLSVVISVFMLGLSLGSWAGGRWISTLTQRSQRSAIYFYAMAEMAIGVGAFVVPRLFSLGEKVLLNLGESNSFDYLVFSAFLVSVSILPWCLCMGATFPFMLAFVKEVYASDPKISASISGQRNRSHAGHLGYGLCAG
jgi:uncharacterized protein (DUF362 family)